MGSAGRVGGVAGRGDLCRRRKTKSIICRVWTDKMRSCGRGKKRGKRMKGRAPETDQETQNGEEDVTLGTRPNPGIDATTATPGTGERGKGSFHSREQHKKWSRIGVTTRGRHFERL